MNTLISPVYNLINVLHQTVFQYFELLRTFNHKLVYSFFAPEFVKKIEAGEKKESESIEVTWKIFVFNARKKLRIIVYKK